MRDISRALGADHKNIKRLLHKLTWEMDKYRWREGVDELARVLFVHLDAEDEAVYARLLTSKNERFAARHYELEHEEIKSCLRRLQQSEPDTTAAIENFAGLLYLFVEHVSEEEQALFPLLADLFNGEQQDEMYRDYFDAKIRLEAEWVPVADVI